MEALNLSSDRLLDDDDDYYILCMYANNLIFNGRKIRDDTYV